MTTRIILHLVLWCLLVIALAQQQQQQQQQHLPDLYRILSIAKNATASEIKRAYKKAALKYHPDKLNHDATEAEIKRFSDQFHLATTAYDILRDEQLRGLYDRGELDASTPTKTANDPSEDEKMRKRYFSRPFALYARTRRAKLSIEFKKKLVQQQEDLDITLQVPITLADRMQTRTVERVIKFEKRTQCTTCQGKGYVLDDHRHEQGASGHHTCGMCNGKGWSLHLFNSTEHAFQQMENTTCSVCQGSGVVHPEKCPVCAGAGTTSLQKELGVEINPGLDNLARRIVQSAGHEGTDGRVGDLVVTFANDINQNFTVEGTTIHHTHYVSLLAIVEGFKHKIKLPSDERVRIDHRGGQTRAFERVIPGKGVVNRVGQRGDLVVHIEPSFDIPLSRRDLKRLLKLLGVDDTSGIHKLQDMLSKRVHRDAYAINTDDVKFIDKQTQQHPP